MGEGDEKRKKEEIGWTNRKRAKESENLQPGPRRSDGASTSQAMDDNHINS
jgi:hypothetical protein